MINALAIGPSGTIFGVSRERGRSAVVQYGRTAKALYSTPDNIHALWVTATGVIHAAGKKHHTNAGGEWHVPKWKTNKFRIDAYALWGTSDDDLWAGGVDGQIHHFDGTGSGDERGAERDHRDGTR